MSKSDGDRAFPLSRENEGWFEPGMTLRDYFAAQALTALLGGPASPHLHKVASARGITPSQAAAMASYEYADAMLEARKDR